MDMISSCLNMLSLAQLLTILCIVQYFALSSSKYTSKELYYFYIFHIFEGLVVPI